VAQGGKSRLFKKFTNCMVQIKELLEETKVSPVSEEKQFEGKSFVSIWGYF
jgi:hypothetical protein